MTKHKATPRQWALVEEDVSELSICSCIFELRARVEALEAATKPAESNYPAEPDSSLVERVDKAMWAGESAPDARAAIREVAAWLHEENHGILSWAVLHLQNQLES